jgi:hypothetical protein
MLPLLVAYPLWIGLTTGRRAGLGALVSVVVAGTGALVLVAATADVPALIETTVIAPSRQPWRIQDRGAAFLAGAIALARLSAPHAAVLALAVPFIGGRPRSWAAVVRRHRWLFPVAIAVVMIPTGFVGWVKIGGGANSFVSVWFLAVGMLAAYASAARRGPRARQVLGTAALVIASALGIRLAGRLAELPELLAARPLPAVAFDAARQAPGTIHFPLRPLVPLMAEGRGEHFTSGIGFRRLEGETITREMVLAYLPPRLDRVAVDRGSVPDVFDDLPRFRKQIRDPLLAAWIVIVEDDGLEDGAPVAAAALDYRDPPTIVPTRVLDVPGIPVPLARATTSIAWQGRRYVVTLDGATAPPVAETALEIELRLRDGHGRHVLTLSVPATPDASGAFTVEQPVLDGFARVVDHAIVLVRSARVGDDNRRLSSETLRALLRAHST